MMHLDSIRLQPEVITHLAGSLAKGRIAQTYLFLGTKSVGKRATADALIGSLLCESLQYGDSGIPRGCGACDACVRLNRGVHPDVTVVRPLGKDIRIDQIRTVQEQAVLHPLMGRWRIFLVEAADQLNDFSANCFLKILEEAPPEVIFVLLAENPGRILPTIHSRAETVRFRTPSHAAAREALADMFPAQADRVAAVYGLTAGLFGRAVHWLSLDEAPNSLWDLPSAVPAFFAGYQEFSARIEDAFADLRSLETALQVLEAGEFLFSPALLRARQGLVRALLLTRRLPRSLPILFADRYVEALQAWKAQAKGALARLLEAQQQNYAAGLLKEVAEQFESVLSGMVMDQKLDFLSTVLRWLEDAFRWSLTGDERLLLNLERKEDIMTLADFWGSAVLQRRMELVMESRQALQRFVQPQLVVENVLSQIGGAEA